MSRASLLPLPSGTNVKMRRSSIVSANVSARAGAPPVADQPTPTGEGAMPVVPGNVDAGIRYCSSLSQSELSPEAIGLCYSCLNCIAKVHVFAGTTRVR